MALWRLAVYFLLASICFTACSPSTPPSSETYDLAITSVDIYDSRNATIIANQTILIRDDRIARIVDEDEQVNANAVIEGRGRLATPGFVDTHTHVLLNFGDGGFGPDEITNEYRTIHAREFLQYGVTTIADMGQPKEWLPMMRYWQATPTTDHPNFVIVGGSLNSTLEWDTAPPMHHHNLASPEEAVEAVNAYHAQGIDRLKLYWKLEQPDMAVIIERANELGMGFYAHVDNGIVSIPEAFELGVRNFEHFFTLPNSVLDQNETGYGALKTLGLPIQPGVTAYENGLAANFAMLESNPGQKTKYEELVSRLAAQNVSISTGLNHTATATGQAIYASSFETVPYSDLKPIGISKTEADGFSDAFHTMMSYVKTAHEAGLSIRIGTDAANGGQAFLSELVLLAEAGIPVADVLRMATWNGASSLNITDRYGALEAGAVADIILFETSPFDDSRGFLSEKVIIKSGREFTYRSSLAFEILKRSAADNMQSALAWYNDNKGSSNFSPLLDVELRQVLYRLIQDGQVSNARDLLEFSNNQFPEFAQKERFLEERPLNLLGYHAIRQNRIDAAIEVFKINTELFPTSANAFDSLAESYMLAGENGRAIANYEISLSLNPNNDNAKAMLEKLR